MKNNLIKKSRKTSKMIGACTDITEHKQSEERALMESTLLEAINKVFREMLMCETDKEVARACLAVAEELTDSKFGFIGEVNKTGRFNTIALSDPGWDFCRMPKSNAVMMIRDMEIRGIWGRVLKDERSLKVNNTSSHPDRVGTPEGHPPITSFMGVPLKQGDRTIGMIGLANKESGYSLADQQAVETLSVAFLEALNRKRAEEALRKSEEKFRDLYDHAPLGYHEYDFEGRITNVNRTDLEMLGYTAEEMIGQPIWKLNINEETVREQVMAKLAGTLPPGKELQRIYRRKDGTTFPVLIEDRLILDEKGRIKGIRCTIQDITNLKQTDEALRRSEEEAKRLAQENAIVAEIGRIISSSLNIDEVYERFADEVRKLIPFDRISITLHNFEENTIIMAYVAGIDVPGRRVGDVISMDGTPNEEIARTRSSLLIQTEDRAELAARFHTLLPNFQIGFRSMMLIPLISKDQLIGVLHFRSIKPNAYTETDLRLAERVGNQIAGAITNAKLFTERKKTEEALSTEKQRFQILSENAPFGIVMIGKDGTFKYINPKFKELFGYDLNDVPDGKTWFRKAYPDPTYRHHVIAQWIHELETFKTGERTPHIFPATCKDRTEKTINFIPVQLETGENLMACEDITEHKQAEEALRRSEEEAKRLAQENAIMAGIGQIISSTLSIEDVYEHIAEEVHKLIPFDRIVISTINHQDFTGTTAYAMGLYIANREIGSPVPLAGTATGEVVHTRSSLLINEENLEEFERQFPNSLSTLQAGFRSMIFVPLLSKDQVIAVFNLRSIKPNLYTENDLKLAERVGNQIAGAIANVQLFSERMRAEEAKKALQEQLRQSQKMEAIGRLAGGIAHDFNNLLTIIKGYSQLSLIDLEEADPLKGNIEEIQKASQRAADLTHQLLAFSRRQVMEMKVLDLNILLRDLDKMLHRVIGEDIELLTLLADDLGGGKVDSGQIEQIIMNLAINSRDAMPNGGKLTIETVNVELDEPYALAHIAVTPGRYVRLSVSDTGFGMSKEVREKVFEPFFTTKEKGKGTGLGLSTVYGIVKQSGGNIWVYSEPGHGTTFKIYLPRVDEPLEKLEGKVAIQEIPRGGETILIVEDDEVVRKLVLRILKKQGYKILEACDGNEALLLCDGRKELPDLVLTDVIMPRMSGHELAERLKSLHPEMKLLYMSGYTDNAIVHHGILEKGINYIEKPFAMEALARKVRELLDR